MIVCDYLTVSTPLENGPALRAACHDVCLRLDGAETQFESVVCGNHARLDFRERMNVATLSASGVMLSKLRAAGLFIELLGSIAANAPYKVTHLDLARDEEQDAPAYLAMLYGRLRVSGAALTRKLIPPNQIKFMVSRCDDGRDSGSIMIGNRKRAETTAIVYDRRVDAIEKGKPDPGYLVRTEIRTGVPGMTLKDAFAPEPLFWHFAAPTFGKRPDDVAPWQPWGEPFTLERALVDDLPARMRRLLECSGDIQRLLSMADQLPGDGLEQLKRMFAFTVATHANTLRFEAGTAQAIGDSARLQ